jgi:hypothetical protein
MITSYPDTVAAAKESLQKTYEICHANAKNEKIAKAYARWNDKFRQNFIAATTDYDTADAVEWSGYSLYPTVLALSKTTMVTAILAAAILTAQGLKIATPVFRLAIASLALYVWHSHFKFKFNEPQRKND